MTTKTRNGEKYQPLLSKQGTYSVLHLVDFPVSSLSPAEQFVGFGEEHECFFLHETENNFYILEDCDERWIMASTLVDLKRIPKEATHLIRRYRFKKEVSTDGTETQVKVDGRTEYYFGELIDGSIFFRGYAILSPRDKSSEQVQSK